MIADILLGVVFALAWVAVADILDLCGALYDSLAFRFSWSFIGAVLVGAVLMATSLVSALSALVVLIAASVILAVLYRRQLDRALR